MVAAPDLARIRVCTRAEVVAERKAAVAAAQASMTLAVDLRPREAGSARATTNPLLISTGDRIAGSTDTEREVLKGGMARLLASITTSTPSHPARADRQY